MTGIFLRMHAVNNLSPWVRQIWRCEKLLVWSWCENAACAFRREKGCDFYLAWEAGGFWLPPAPEAGEPVAGCAASEPPAWCPFAPASCQSASSAPVLKETDTQINTKHPIYQQWQTFTSFLFLINTQVKWPSSDWCTLFWGPKKGGAWPWCAFTFLHLFLLSRSRTKRQKHIDFRKKINGKDVAFKAAWIK